MEANPQLMYTSLINFARIWHFDIGPKSQLIFSYVEWLVRISSNFVWEVDT